MLSRYRRGHAFGRERDHDVFCIVSPRDVVNEIIVARTRDMHREHGALLPVPTGTTMVGDGIWKTRVSIDVYPHYCNCILYPLYSSCSKREQLHSWTRSPALFLLVEQGFNMGLGICNDVYTLYSPWSLHSLGYRSWWYPVSFSLHLCSWDSWLKIFND
jgi:hypothetical protein